MTNISSKLALGSANFGLDYGVANNSGKISEIELTEINAKTSKATIIKGNDEIEQSLNNGLLIRPLTNKQKKNLVDELDNMDY